MLIVKFVCDNCGDVHKVIQGGVTKYILQEKVKYVDENGEEHEIGGPDAPCHKCQAAIEMASNAALESRKKQNGTT